MRGNYYFLNMLAKAEDILPRMTAEAAAQGYNIGYGGV